MSQKESTTSRRTEIRFRNRFAKGESRASRREKNRFKRRSVKGKK